MECDIIGWRFTGTSRKLMSRACGVQRSTPTRIIRHCQCSRGRNGPLNSGANGLGKGSDSKSFLGSIPICESFTSTPLRHHRRHEAPILPPFTSPLRFFLPALSCSYYEQLAPETKHLHKRRLLINRRSPLLPPLPLSLYHKREDAARIPSHLFCPHALRCLHKRHIERPV